MGGAVYEGVVLGGAVLEDAVLGGALLGRDGMKRGSIRRAAAV